MQRVTPGISDAFGPVEEEIAKAFLLALFKVVGDGALGRAITRLPVLRGRPSWIREGHPRLLDGQAGDVPPWGPVPYALEQCGEERLCDLLLHWAEGVTNPRGDPLHECPLLLE